MKKILITGANSCVGKTIEKWLEKWPESYKVDTLDMVNASWKEYNFGGYDVVYHVAGIAHVTLDPSMESIFYKVNRDLTIETAIKAKESGVNQFIFMSSGIVYGDSADVGKEFVITKDTEPNPANFYGMSKLQAEEGLKELEDENFKVVIVRSPALYGIGMKSHYNNLSDFAKKYSIFPKIYNQRSMLYNKNLAEFIRLMIENEESGTFWPQNKEYTSTVGIIRDVASVNGRKMHLLPFPKFLAKMGAKLVPALRKAFGNFVYDATISEYKEEYRIYSYEASIEEIENSNEELLVEKLM